MPSDPVPLVKHWCFWVPVSDGTDTPQACYLADSVDLALAAKDETIAALRSDLESIRGIYAAVRQQLADAQQRLEE